MSDTKEKHATFTPGPWQISCIDGVKDSLMVGGGDDGSDIVADIRDEANARLIAAAPEMYEMCKLLEECMENIDGKDGWDASYELAKVREVLAKVDGGEG